MTVLSDAILELETKEKEMLWDAVGHYYSYCIKQIDEGHVAADIFKERRNQCEKFLGKAYMYWERSYH